MVDFPNWFTMTAEANFVSHLRPNVDRTEPLHALQLGVFTGDASLWLMENILTHPESTLTDVDTWQGSDEPQHAGMNFARAENVYDEKLATWLSNAENGEGPCIYKEKMDTRAFFVVSGEMTYDFIYVDASHKAIDVLRDAIFADASLIVGGILAFDDYIWGEGYELMDTPKPAIDTFMRFYADKYQVLGINNQVWLRKTA